MNTMKGMNTFRIIEFPYFSDDRGETVPFEFEDQIPFEVKRVYVVTGNENETRGGHSHNTEEELFVCVAGSVTALVNDGDGDQEITLDKKNKGLYIPTHCWHEFTSFSKNAVLMAFSSTHYEGRTDYVEDKDEFLEQNQ